MRKYIILLLFSLLSFLLSAQGISSLQQKKLLNAISAITNLYVDTINDKKMVETANRVNA